MIFCFSCWVKPRVTTALSASAVQMAQPFSARRSGECAIRETNARPIAPRRWVYLETGRQVTREARRAPPRTLLHRRLNDQPNALPRSRDGSSPPALYDYDHGPVRTPAIGASKASDRALALDSNGR